MSEEDEAMFGDEDDAQLSDMLVMLLLFAVVVGVLVVATCYPPAMPSVQFQP